MPVTANFAFARSPTICVQPTTSPGGAALHVDARRVVGERRCVLDAHHVEARVARELLREEVLHQGREAGGLDVARWEAGDEDRRLGVGGEGAGREGRGQGEEG